MWDQVPDDVDVQEGGKCIEVQSQAVPDGAVARQQREVLARVFGARGGQEEGRRRAGGGQEGSGEDVTGKGGEMVQRVARA